MRVGSQLVPVRESLDEREYRTLWIAWPFVVREKEGGGGGRDETGVVPPMTLFFGVLARRVGSRTSGKEHSGGDCKFTGVGKHMRVRAGMVSFVKFGSVGKMLLFSSPRRHLGGLDFCCAA